jgi:hypothetical protein
MSDLPLKENPPLSHVSRPLGPEVFELWFDSRANDDRDWLTPNRLLKYYPFKTFTPWPSLEEDRINVLPTGADGAGV